MVYRLLIAKDQRKCTHSCSETDIKMAIYTCYEKVHVDKKIYLLSCFNMGKVTNYELSLKSLISTPFINKYARHHSRYKQQEAAYEPIYEINTQSKKSIY